MSLTSSTRIWRTCRKLQIVHHEVLNTQIFTFLREENFFFLSEVAKDRSDVHCDDKRTSKRHRNEGHREREREKESDRVEKERKGWGGELVKRGRNAS